MSLKIFLLISFLYATYVVVEALHIRDHTSGDNYAQDVNQNDSERLEYLMKDIGLTKETNVEIKQNYLECDNINSQVQTLTADFNIISDESCDTVYRFPPSQIIYQVTFKNGSSAKIQIKLELQESQINQDKAIVTLTGKVVDGYMSGAHFQSVILYPALNNSIVCSSEPGITEIESISASVTFILLPTIAEQNDSRSYRALHLPEAFDCFGNTTIKYNPGLLQSTK